MLPHIALVRRQPDLWPAASIQYSIRSLLLLVVAVAVPCCWLAVEMEKAKKQNAVGEGALEDVLHSSSL